ncbi:hypothetical protein [Neptuniibacter sp. QD37_11]|uniref:hypothetical protein n=1 Tax=Neptuniibacter sp. QD37_11 TaxID=3398209 RepID=UPI0039F520C1
MSKHELQNGCTDKRLPEWAERAWAHSVVNSSQQWSEISKEWFEIIAQVETMGATDDDLAALANTECLYVGFVSLDAGDSQAALLCTAADIVVLLYEYDDFTEAEGLMTHEAFWEYLGSFPNVYKHLRIGNGRQKYWQRPETLDS